MLKPKQIQVWSDDSEWPVPASPGTAALASVPNQRNNGGDTWLTYIQQVREICIVPNKESEENSLRCSVTPLATGDWQS